MDVLGNIIFSKHQCLMVLKTCDVLSCSLGYLSLCPKYNQSTMQYPNLKQNKN
jgi:hypothetical protein